MKNLRSFFLRLILRGLPRIIKFIEIFRGLPRGGSFWIFTYISFFWVAMIGTAFSAAKPTIPANYLPAVNQTQIKERVVTNYVPVPMPGQLMPIKKLPILISGVPNKSEHRLVGEAAVNAANERAKQQPSSAQYINSIMNYYYMPGALYQIYCAPLNVTDVEFQSGEQVISIAAGDTLRWEVSKTFSGSGVDRREHLLIKPVDENLNNNLVVTTNLRTYHLELKSTSAAYMASVTWRYPPQNSVDGLVQTFDADHDIPTESINSGKELSPELSLSNLDFNYEANIFSSKTPTWMPTMVFNNGDKTFIQFPQNLQVAPTLFVGDPNNERTINYRIEGNYYIVDQVVKSLILRVGQTDPVIVQIVHG